MATALDLHMEILINLIWLLRIHKWRLNQVSGVLYYLHDWKQVYCVD